MNERDMSGDGGVAPEPVQPGRVAEVGRRGREPAAPIRVLIADDHPILRAGIAGVLSDEPDIEIVGEASDGDAAISQAASIRPDVVLMDLRMPRTDGVAATAAITSAETSRVLILTTYESDDRIVAAIEAGAAGYLLKAAPHEEIIAGIRAVAAGQSALSPQLAVRLVQRMRSPAVVGTPSARSGAALTDREREVLALVAKGFGNKQIAAELGIGAATVKTHLQRVFDKLQVTDRTRAVTLALEKGLLGT